MQKSKVLFSHPLPEAFTSALASTEGSAPTGDPTFSEVVLAIVKAYSGGEPTAVNADAGRAGLLQLTAPTIGDMQRLLSPAAQARHGLPPMLAAYKKAVAEGFSGPHLVQAVAQAVGGEPPEAPVVELYGAAGLDALAGAIVLTPPGPAPASAATGGAAATTPGGADVASALAKQTEALSHVAELLAELVKKG